MKNDVYVLKHNNITITPGQIWIWQTKFVIKVKVVECANWGARCKVLYSNYSVYKVDDFVRLGFNDTHSKYTLLKSKCKDCESGRL